MPEYLTPGVYIEEIERGPRPIEGVPTSTAAFIGETERGPVLPLLVTSYNDYRRWFGNVFGDLPRYMPYAVSGFFDNGGKRLYVSRVVGKNAETAMLEAAPFSLRALGPGEWGNRIWVKTQPGSTRDAGGTSIGFRLRLAYWSTLPDPTYDPFSEEEDARKARPRPTLVEDFDDLSYDPASSDYFGKRLPGNSVLVALTVAEGTPANTPMDDIPGTFLADGDDGDAPLEADFKGEADEGRQVQGLEILKQDAYRDVALVHAPYPREDPVLIGKRVVEHCEANKFRFAVVDCDPHQANVSELVPRSKVTDSQYGAFYYPWLYVSDPRTGARKLVPPGGHTLGIYARTDTERGVFKAPANEIVRGAIDLEYAIDDERQGTLNPAGVNVTRNFPGRGIRVWGARTLSSNGLWKYVSVRRLFIFLERSIYEGTQWVVFEPNDDRLWARVKDTIRLFLRTQWRDGALFGRTEDEAFFITCDRTTMTQDDILNGRLKCQIGIAPVRPAEFVIFQIFQNTAESQR